MADEIIAEKNAATGAWTNYVFFDGERVARQDFPSNAVSYYFSDHLKTTDIVTDAQGNIKNESDFYPWGGEVQFLDNDSNHYKFTGKERDTETGLDNFGARYYSNGLGRFVTVDPKIISRQRIVDPQQWNMYGYSRNNPTSYFDPDGREVHALDAGALNRIKQTLPAGARSSVVTDKNGFISKGPLNALKNSDGNVRALQKLVNNSKTVEVSTGTGYTKTDGKTETFFYRSDATERAQRTAEGIPNTPGKDYTTFHDGQTLKPSEGKSGNEEVHISDGTGKAAEAPDIELTVTMGHELYVHALRDLEGQPSEHEVRNPDGPVNKETKEVEERTRKNAQEKDPK